MLITVIVAVYNIEKYISRCIESIQNQSYSNLEIILVDDGSTDSAGEICDTYAKSDFRIKVVHQKNGGLSAARNTGIGIATGDYISFIDGDDWIEPNMYQLMMNQVTEHGADLVACRYRCIYKDHDVDKSTGKITIFTAQYEMLIKYLEEDEDYLIQHAAWNKLYARSLLGNERFPEGEWYEDIVFSAKILSRVKTGVYIDKALYNYVCQREDSIMNAGMTERIFTDRIPAYIKKEQFLNGLGVLQPVSIHRFYFYKRLLEFYRELYKKQNKKLRKYQEYIRSILMNRKDTFDSVYSIGIATSSDRKKMQIYMISPILFRMVMNLNDRFILPIKLKRMGKKEC